MNKACDYSKAEFGLQEGLVPRLIYASVEHEDFKCLLNVYQLKHEGFSQTSSP